MPMYCKMSESAILVKNLSKAYKLYNKNIDRLKESLHPLGRKYHRLFYALKDVSFTLPKGEILGVVGRNGAGKSTLLNILAGVLTPSRGQVITNGYISALLGLGTGFNPELTGIENIYFNGTLMGYSREEMDARLEDIIAFADIGDFIYQPLKIYSSGMKARLGFAVAIHINPEILILDEILAVGDILFKRKCYAKMQEFFNANKTIVLSSNNPANIIELCRRTILLDKGELILDGPPKLVTMYYQKMLYARPENQSEIREEIIRLNQTEERERDFAAGMNAGEEEPGNSKVMAGEFGITAQDPKSKAFFIPDFEPKSTVKQKDYDLDIFDARIQTLSGQEVNALVMDETYLFSYQVKFNLDLENVRFTTLVQNEKGLPISGISVTREKDDKTGKIKKGETYLIQFKFKCTLLPGTYYISVSVLCIDKNERVPLIRVNDIAVFKVQEETDLNYWGIVNLGQRGRIVKLT